MADDLAWETLATKTAYTCPGFDVVHEDVRLPDGTESDFDFLREGDSVVILPFTADGDVVVIEEWRQAVKRVNRALPAGSVEADDDAPRAAVSRELREETGYEADEVSHLYTAEPANGYADSVFHYFLAEGCTPTAEQDLDFNESIRVETTAFEALLASLRTGDLQDGRSAVGVMYYALFER
ncbi:MULTISPECIES: NUDIX hydrolase [Haloarcula]|uniref:NUDIX hydrolase n=1 Tax=Haloarcula pellucida TaxID=1427151 RepID=A0A830GKG0_9EURY|nr:MULTISPECIES: NUDIX hydrolase [Halomicroarcula]MBX0348650.1 NUDIX hydrolase [Halomicroarcula pellucida]MDS0278453.1 NUDIX hydrolase [Halomicroarcula sp. S1AR25-4]GGN92426.1 NUDIX hydrolase [Halomicroarcula pellucida]